MTTIFQDIRYGFRMLLVRPGFTAVIVLALALGIGANSAIFSVVNGVVMQPLPYESPDQLAIIWEHNFKRNRMRNVVAGANFLDWQRESRSFQGISAFSSGRVTLTGDSEPERIRSERTTANYFSLLGVSPAIGRTYTPEEDSPAGTSVAVLSHSLWQRRFGGDTDILGQSLIINGNNVVVAGVMPADFKPFNAETEIWLPLRLNPANDYRANAGRWLMVFGRLKPGVTIEQAQAEMGTIGRQLEQEYPKFNTGWGVNLVTMHEQIVGDVRPALLVLLGAVGFVLLIACANVANLLLARAASRQREIAIRSSLGAGKSRIVRQLLTESILLSGLGGALGLLFAVWGLQLLVGFSPENIPRLENVRIDGTVLGFTFVISLLTGIVFGVVPGIAAGRTNPNMALKEGIRGAGASSGRKSRRVLVVVEVALSLVLLVCAGLMMKSFLTLQNVNPGFNTEQVLTLKAPLPFSQYQEPEQRVGFYQQLIDRIETLPSVQSASAISAAPFTGMASATSFMVGGRPEPPPGEKPVTDVRWIQPGYFKTMGVPLLKGRVLTDQDMTPDSRVLVINETMARQMFPNEDPIGKHLIIGWGDDVVDEIIGVVQDTKHMGLDTDIRPMMYWPHSREPSGFMYILVHTLGDPISLMNAVKGEIHDMDPLLPVYDMKTMEAWVNESIAQPQFNTLMLGLFSLVALILAAVGIYGVMAYTVSQRIQELGIRMALGAQKGDVLRLVVRQGMILAGTGIVVGLLAALATTHVLSSLLFEVSTTDPITYIAIALILAGIAFLACYLPARRATHVDPMVALRYE